MGGYAPQDPPHRGLFCFDEKYEIPTFKLQSDCGAEPPVRSTQTSIYDAEPSTQTSNSNFQLQYSNLLPTSNSNFQLQLPTYFQYPTPTSNSNFPPRSGVRGGLRPPCYAPLRIVSKYVSIISYLVLLSKYCTKTKGVICFRGTAVAI